MKIEEMQARIVSALTMFFSTDEDLLKNKPIEMTLSFQIAMFIRQEFLDLEKRF